MTCPYPGCTKAVTPGRALCWDHDRLLTLAELGALAPLARMLADGELSAVAYRERCGAVIEGVVARQERNLFE